MSHPTCLPSSSATAFRGEGDYYWSEDPEPHAARRREMLEKYPHVKDLYGPCPKTKYVCTAMVLVQLGLSFLLKDAPWWLILVVAYAFGGVINQSLLLAIHELSHNLAFKKPTHNRLFGFFVNLPVGIPVSAAFREYHLMHHTHQGTDGIDTDIPTELEARLVRSRFAKLLWLAGQGLAYGLRPLFMMPLRPQRWIVANFIVQVLFDFVIYHFWGVKALAYFPVSTLLVMGLHPIAGHYISEHYVFERSVSERNVFERSVSERNVVAPPQETYSYYGPLNKIAFNVGYHNEHHDFPYIAGSRLPELRALAPEYYDNLVSHTSWTKTLWDYVMRPELNGTCRVKRKAPSGSLKQSESLFTPP